MSTKFMIKINELLNDIDKYKFFKFVTKNLPNFVIKESESGEEDDEDCAELFIEESEKRIKYSDDDLSLYNIKNDSLCMRVDNGYSVPLTIKIYYDEVYDKLKRRLIGVDCNHEDSRVDISKVIPKYKKSIFSLGEKGWAFRNGHDYKKLIQSGERSSA